METIADKSRTKEIIEKLQSIMEGASPVPLASGKVMIYKDEVQSLLTELSAQINMEIKTYHEVNDRKGKIINEAKKEAERIIYQAEHTASRMRVNRRTTNVDPVDFSMLSQEELDELNNANEIYGASLIYTDEMLTEVSNLINDTYQNIKSDYEIILNVMEEKLATLAENRKELMEGLSDMDAKDRSQQILEIGQLLSDELFNARMNGRRNPDMYDDGSMQLSLDLKTEQEIRAQEAEAAAIEAMNNAKQKELEAEEAKANAKEAELELAKMKEERDKLRAEMSFLKSLKEKAASKTEKIEGLSDTDDEEEYEIVYVTEDELEEGEEYEIEYVDDYDEETRSGTDVIEEDNPKESEESWKTDENSDLTEAEEIEDNKQIEDNSELEEKVEPEEKMGSEVDQEPEHEKEPGAGTSTEMNTELEKADIGIGTVPMIPHFTKSEKIASVPSEKIVKMANAITTDKKYSGLISRAVAEREKKEEEDVITVEKPDFEITEF